MSRSPDTNSSIEMSQQFENVQFLEDIDPSVEGGYKIVYDREVPLELRTNADAEAPSQEIGSLESIKVKILILPGQPGERLNNNAQYKMIKIEFTSETDLFFNYISEIDEEMFQRSKQEQGIKIEFSEYLAWLIKLFNQCYKEPHNFFGVFHMMEGAERYAHLDFIENMGYKFLEIIKLDFIAISEEFIKQNVIYRYNILKAKMVFVQSRLEDISSLIKLKNPSLLLQIQKNSFGGGNNNSYDHNNSSVFRTGGANNSNVSKYNPNNSRMYNR